MSPTQRTLDYLRKSGFRCAVVEQTITIRARDGEPASGFKRDLFGFGDVLGIRPAAKELLLVQCTSLSNISSRVKKAKGLPGLLAWLQCGGRAEVWGWFKGRREPRRQEILPDDIVVDLTPKRRGRKDKNQGFLFGGS